MSIKPGEECNLNLDVASRRIAVTEIEPRSDAVLIAVTGDLDIGTKATFHRRLSEILDGRDGQRLELDLSALVFCDLTGLRGLHALGRACLQSGRQVRITTAGPCLNELLRLCRTPVLLDYASPHNTLGK
ncbi:STAS domain-containing protein [Actinoplanes sp. NBC_00393]|uniref:STAS domain-containing protein n=1 Tax=Actinoplanes sp. NBC_00393 TaxID=2975953 RepID=UPI002E1A0B2F